MSDFVNVCVCCGKELPLEWNSWICHECDRMSKIKGEGKSENDNT